MCVYSTRAHEQVLLLDCQQVLLLGVLSVSYQIALMSVPSASSLCDNICLLYAHGSDVSALVPLVRIEMATLPR